MFKSINIFALIFISVRPSKNSFALYYSIFPLTDILAIINIGKWPFTIEFSIFEISFVYAWVRNISAFAIFDSILELTFIVWAIRKFLLPITCRHIVNPLSFIAIPLIRIIIAAIAIRLIVTDSSLIHTAIVIYVTTLTCSCALFESALIIRAVFEVELAFAVKLIVLPLSQIIPVWDLHLL